MSKMALDGRLEAIQRSTKTLMPWMVPVHDRLRMKYGWYYRWSMLRYSSLVHYVVLFIFLLGFGTGALAYYGFLPSKARAAAVTCYWIGGDGNWNDATHWSDTTGGSGSTCDSGVVPGSDDIATIDGSSGAPIITVNAAVDVAGFAMSAGTLNQGANTFAVGTSDFVLSGGTFTGGSSNMTITGDFTISSGAFTTTSAIMYISPGSATEGDWTHTAGGTFTASAGTVEFTGVASTIDVTTSETFNNLTLNKNGFTSLSGAQSDTLTVAGTFNATNGSWSRSGTVATVDAQGSATLGSGFDGGNAAISFTGSAASTITVQAGTFPAITMNAANATMNGPSTGTANLGGGFTFSAGTFSGGAGSVTVSYGFTISGGAFTAPSATLTLSSSCNFTHTAGGTFDANGGSVVFSGSGAPTIDVTGSETFYALTFNKTAGGATGLSSDTLIVAGTLNLTESTVTTGTIQAQGAVAIASTFDGGDAALQLTGGNTQTFTQTAGGVMPTGTFTINKTAGTAVNLAAALTLATAGQDLTLTQGILDLKGYALTLTSAGDVLTISANGILQMQGGEAVTASTKTISTGATIIYTGDGGADVDTYTITTNFATNYYHLTINSTDTGDIFQLGAAASMDGTLTVTQGILSLNGSNLTDTAGGDVAARGNIAGTVRLQGGETIFWTTNDTDSGTYDYVGDGAGGTATFTVKDFGVGADYYNFTINSTAGDETFNLAAATDVNYTLTITAGTLDVTGTNFTVNVGKNWANTGSFTAQNGEVVFDGTLQTISGATTFNDLTKQVGTADTLTFTAASTQTINGALTLNGADTQLLSLRSSVDTTYWNIVNTGDTEAVSYVDVKDSNNTGATITAVTSTNSEHNVGWSFTGASVTVSGTGQDASGAALTGTSYNVALRVDGVALQTTTTNIADGTWSFSVEGLVAGNVIHIYFYGASDSAAGTYVGNAVTETDAATAITGVNLKANNVLLRADNAAAALSIDDMAFYDSSDNPNNLLFTAVAAIPDTLTIGDGIGLTVNSGDTFTPGGNSTIGTGGLTIAGAWTATGTETIGISGSWDSTAGTFTAASSTVTFTGDSTSVDVNASVTFSNLTLNKNTGMVLTITGGDTLAVGGTLTLTDGYVNTGTIALNTANLTGTSTFDGGSATILLDDSQSVTLSNGWVLPTLNVSAATVTIANSASITFANAGLTVGPGGTLTQGTGTTVSFTGTGDRTIDVNASQTLVNLTINKAADGNIITIAAGDALVLTGTLTLTNGQVNTGTLQAQGDVSLGAGFDGGDAVLQFTGAATQSMTDSGGVLPSGTVTVNKTVGTAVNLAAALTLDTAGQDLTITSGTLNLAGFGLTLTAAADVLTVDASGTLQLQGGETITATTKTLNAGSTVTYNGSSGPYTLQSLSYSNLTIAGGPSVVFSLPGNTTGITTLTITSGILATAGYNLTATTLVNDATLRLQGNETTVTFTTMDTTSGAVEYVGRNVAETLTVKDFGGTDYYDLTINDANTNKATFQLGAASVLGRNLALTSGTLDLASFDLTVPTDFTIGASGTLKLQGGETVSAIDNNSGTVNYNGTGSYTTALAAGNTYTNLIFSGSGTWEPASAVAVSGALTISAGVFDTDGQNLVVTGALTNDATLRMSGAETTVTFGTMDTNSGTVVYDGNNTTNTYAIKDFGANDYYHLSFTDANASKITLQLANTNTLTVLGNLTLSSGSGTFDNATYDEAVNVTGNVTMDNTRTDMGDATWTTSGNFDNYDVGTFNRNTSTLVMNGNEKNIVTNTGKYFRNLTISEGVSITLPSGNGVCGVYGTAIINGTINVIGGNFNGYSGADIKISSTGRVTGSNSMMLHDAAKMTQQDGTIDIATFQITMSHTSSYPVVPSTIASASVRIYGQTTTDYTWAPSAGTYIFNGNVTFGENTGSGTYTIDNSAGANFVFKGNVTITNGTSTLNWTKGAGTITFAKASGTQTVNFLDKTVEDIIIGDGSTTNTVQLTDGVTTDSFTVNSGATLDMNSQAVSYAAANGTTNNGTIKLIGNETLTNISNLDTDSGWVQYTGTGVYGALPYTGTYNNVNFSGSGSYTLPATLDVNGEFAINGSTVTAPSTSLNVGGNFTHASGTFTHNSGAVIFDGSASTISGSTTFNDLTAQTAGQTLTFTAGTTQTVGGALTLTGTAGNLVTLASSSTGDDWNIINNGASNTANYVSVSDSNLTGTSIFAYNSTNGGGNSSSWVFPNSYTMALTNTAINSSQLVPGTSYGYTLTLYDSNGAVATGLNSDVNLTFSGNTSSSGYVPTATDKNGTSTQFGNATTLTFTAGVATTNITLYKTEQASFTVTDSSNIIGTATFTTLSPSGVITSITDASTGNTTYSSGPTTLTLTPTRATKVKVSNADTFSGNSYENLSTLTASGASYTKAWTLPDGDGAKTVYAKYSDDYGNESANATGSITRDNTGPAVANAYGYDVANPSTNTYAILVSFQPATDAASGITNAGDIGSYTVKRNGDAVTVDSATSYTTDKSGTKVFYILDSGLQPNTDYTYAISVKDALGNTGETKATVAPTTANLKAGKDITSTIIRLSSSSNQQALLKELGKLELSKAEAKSDASSAKKDEVIGNISWLSSIPATSQVFYGPDKNLSYQTELDTGLNTSHQAVLTGLKPDTTYSYKVVSKDANGNSAEISGQSLRTGKAESKESILNIIVRKIMGLVNEVWGAIKSFFTFGRASAAPTGNIYVIDISSAQQPAHFISWPKGMGSAALQQCSPGCSTITTTGANFFVATNVKAGTGYSYKVGSLATNLDSAPVKTPEITKINAKALTTGAIITWRTDNEPSTSLVSYGASAAAELQSPKDPYFNQSHTVYLNNLKPQTTYYFKVASANKSGTAVASDTQTFTTEKAETPESIFEQIINALMKAFKVFEVWINE